MIAATLKRRMESQQASGRTLTLKLKYTDYQQVTRSKTLLHLIDDLDSILGLAAELLATIDVGQKPVRLLGLSLSSLNGETDAEFVQLSLGFP